MNPDALQAIKEYAFPQIWTGGSLPPESVIVL